MRRGGLHVEPLIASADVSIYGLINFLFLEIGKSDRRLGINALGQQLEGFSDPGSKVCLIDC